MGGGEAAEAAAAARVAELEVELAEAHRAAADTTALDAAEARVAQLESELADALASAGDPAELEAARARVAELEREVELERERSAGAAADPEAFGGDLELLEARARVAELEHELAEAREAASAQGPNGAASATSPDITALERELADARSEIGVLADERDRALSDAAIALADREQLSDSLTELQASRNVSAATLQGELRSVRSLVDEIEEIATGQLCAEDETNEYAIGANDSAVLVLNAIADAQ